MAAVAPSITPADRLSFTTFLAIAVHAAIILGVTFTYLKGGPSTHTMEVTLAQNRSTTAPDMADFLAQLSQAGSGTLDEKQLTTTPQSAVFQDTEIRRTFPVATQSTFESPDPREMLRAITTESPSQTKSFIDQADTVNNKDQEQVKTQKSLLERSLEIASLEARLDRQRQIYAKRPRIKRLTSLSTKASADAFYLNSWRRRIETIGNLNYPEEARRRKLYGSLRLLVAVLPNGALKEVAILESSGHNVLDDSAVRIVKLAAPFAPFPRELSETTDILEIIRTWQFRKNSSLRSY